MFQASEFHISTMRIHSRFIAVIPSVYSVFFCIQIYHIIPMSLFMNFEFMFTVFDYVFGTKYSKFRLVNWLVSNFEQHFVVSFNRTALQCFQFHSCFSSSESIFEYRNALVCQYIYSFSLYIINHLHWFTHRQKQFNGGKEAKKKKNYRISCSI